MRGHVAEQCAGRRPEDHGHAAAGDGSAAEGDDHEPEGDDQRTHLKVGPVREPERRRGRAARGQEERAREQKHNGGRIEGPRGHFGATITDFTVAEAEIRESGGRAAAAAAGDMFHSVGGCAQRSVNPAPLLTSE